MAVTTFEVDIEGCWGYSISALTMSSAIDESGLDVQHLRWFHWVTVDIGSNVTAAVEILGWNGLSCFDHNLHLKDMIGSIVRLDGIAYK